jgi:WD40-like Beta Propeller Repeat
LFVPVSKVILLAEVQPLAQSLRPVLFCVVLWSALISFSIASARQAPAKAPPAQASKPSSQAASAPAAAPNAPQSTHFPILLLIEAADQSWDLRIGQKGPERLDRPNYPPIPLEAVEVVREGAGDTWTYHAKDMQTGAAVAARITREPCATPGAPDVSAKSKWIFTATVEHAQLGTLQGCGRVATDLFPRINNQLTPSDDDDNVKPKTPPPTITKFKSPIAFAYLATTDKILIKRGTLVKSTSGKEVADLDVSHEGRQLLFSRESSPGVRNIYEYDLTTGQSKPLIQANSSQPFWSPDDSQIAFLENVSGKSQLWLMPANAPDRAAPASQNEVTTLDGWADAATLLTSDLQTLSWIGTDGTAKETVSAADLYGKDQFKLSSANSVRVHPLNPDLLLVSAEVAGPLQPPITVYDIPNPSPDAPRAPKKEEGKPAQALFLYEVHSKRRILLSPLNLTATQPEWSRDGLQVFFTGRPSPSSAPTIYRIFWDGTGLTKVHDGSDFVVGQ